MWLKCSLCSKNCFLPYSRSAIFFELSPDNSKLFSISLEGSSYRESTVNHSESLKVNSIYKRRFETFSIFFSIKIRCDNSVPLQNISKGKFYFILTLQNPNLQRLICLKAQTYHLRYSLTRIQLGQPIFWLQGLAWIEGPSPMLQ